VFLTEFTSLYSLNTQRGWAHLRITQKDLRRCENDGYLKDLDENGFIRLRKWTKWQRYVSTLIQIQDGRSLG